DLEVVLADLRARGIPAIVDAKRGDIGSTAEQYAAAYLGDGPLRTDAVTVNPALGLGTLEPFRAAARAADRGVLVLLRTSNPDAAVFQDVWEGALIEAIAAEPAYGAVVGATDAAAGARLRAALPETLFLVPGFGAQGGGNLSPFFTDGRGAVVNSSRRILYAGESLGWAARREAIRDAARSAHATIERARK
ncbi:MAG: orotidine-5'-phosphate decarboxylase, partial [Planctomycetota bacterium]|nr:orotidine-5'-phosphate decarboxylase [Planctomycetota bacterium]